ncbi:hypothetical protein KY385_03455 [Candidatus Parcubacteria bacterium]|nr:hypothetical protein [Candidatus Parcubacteria bacterium]
MGQKRVFWLFVVLALVYILLNVFRPPEASSLSRGQITPDQVRLLRLTLTIPIIAIMFIGFYGFSKVKSYAEAVAESSEGPAFNKIAQGLLILALWIPITAIVRNTASYIAYSNPNYTEAAIIIRNYINVAMVLLSLYLLYQGSKLLIRRAKKVSLPSRGVFNAIFFILSVFFVYFTLANPNRQFPSKANSVAAYYLPDWLLIPTIIVPYLAALYFGLQAVQNILLYRYKVKGILYRQALARLANGMGVAVLALIAVGFLSAFTNFFNNVNLKVLLLIYYGLLIFVAIGYVLIALGAKKLHRIEEA